MAGQGNDFFLNFGSDAAPFSEKLASDLEPGIAKINQLREALAAYDEQAARSKGGSSPLGLTFQNLDGAADKIEKATAGFTRQFADMVGKIDGLAETLKSAMQSVRTAGDATGRARPPLPPQRPPVGQQQRGGISDVDPEIRRRLNELDRQKAAARGTNATAVTPSDQAAVSNTRRTADNAKGSLDDLSNINANFAKDTKTLAKSLESLDTRLKSLIETAGKFGGKPAATAEDSDRRRENNLSEIQVGNTASNPIPVIVVGGDAHPLGGHPHGIQTPTTATTATSTQSAKDELAAAAEVVNGDNSKRRPARRSSGDVATPGEWVLLPGEKSPTRIGSGARKNETIGDYTSRVQSVSSRDTALGSSLPSLSEDDQAILNAFRKSGGKAADAQIRSIAQGNGSISIDPKLNTRIARSNGRPGALTPEQMEKLPDILSRFEDINTQRRSAYDEFAQQEVQRDPHATVDSLSDEARGGFRRLNHQIVGDEEYAAQPDTPRYQGAVNRQNIAASGYETVQNSKAQAFIANSQAQLEARAELQRQSDDWLSDMAHARQQAASEPVSAPATPAATSRVRAQRPVTQQLQASDTGSILEPISAQARATADLPAVSASDVQQANVNERLVTELHDVERALRDISDEVGRVKRIQSPRGTKLSGGARTGFQSGDDELEGARAGLEAEAARLRAQLDSTESVPAQSSSGGAKPPTPPRPPAPPAGSNPEPEPRRIPVPIGGRGGAKDLDADVSRQNALAQLDEETQRQLLAARARLSTPLGPDTGASQRLRDQTIAQAGAAFKGDSQYQNIFENAGQRANTFADILGLDSTDKDTRHYVRGVLQQGGSADDYNLKQAQRSETANDNLKVSDAASGGSDAERVARVNDIITESSGRLREARLAEYVAEQRLQTLRQSEVATAEQVARAEIQLSVASRNTAAAREQEAKAQANANPNTFQRLTGRNTSFSQDLIRHGTSALENTIGYSIVFTGFEQLRELVHTGIEAEAAFVRLQASLDANGESAGKLRTNLASISAQTATPIEHITEAASELVGVFNNAGDLAFGTKISAQLANISQGTLTAKDAAVGLRDVLDAYSNAPENSGKSPTDLAQETGDQIAHLSQLTGVSVKDITEGTTQIAQEAREFGLTQKQASTLAAYVSRGTGESGEESAAQTSRLLSTFYNGKAQQTLVNSGVASVEQFQSGDIAGVLSNLIEKYDKLAPAQKQAIAGLIGTGIQARAFASIMNIGTQGLSEFNNKSNDMGALQQQNQRVLATVAGQIKQLDEDFQNLGASLSRVGAFDFIGVLAKSMDALLKVVNSVFNTIDDVLGGSQFGKSIEHLTVLILEAAAAWKLFGGVVSTGLGKLGILSPTTSSVAARSAAQAEGAAVLPALDYGRANARQTGRAIGTRAVSGVRNIPRNLLATQADRFTIAQGGTPSVFGNAVGRYRVASGAAVRDGSNALTRFGNRTVDSAISRTEGGVGTASLAAVGRSAQVAGSSMTGLRSALEGTAVASRAASIGIGALQTVALAGVVYIFSAITAALQQRADDITNRDAALSTLTGQSGSAAPPDNRTDDQKTLDDARTKAMKPESRTAFVGDTLLHPFGLFGGTRQTGPSDLSGNLSINTYQTQLKKLRDAEKTNDPKQIAAAQKAINDYYKSNADALSKFGTTDPNVIAKLKAIGNKGNDPAGQTALLAELNNQLTQINSEAETRLQVAKGFAQIDSLNQQQMAQLTTVLSQVGGLNNDTLTSQGAAVSQLLENSGAPVGSRQYTELQQSVGINPQVGMTGINSSGRIGHYDKNGKFVDETERLGKNIGPTEGAQLPNLIAPVTTQQGQLKQRLGAYQDLIKQKTNLLNDPTHIQNIGGAGSDQYNTEEQELADLLNQYQQTKQTIVQNGIGASGNLAGLQESQGNDAGAASALRDQNSKLEAYNDSLKKDDPQYYANLQQIQQNKLKIAQLLSNPLIQGLQISESSATDAVTKAQLDSQIAQAQLAALPANAPTATVSDAKAQVNQKAIAERQAQQALTEAQAQQANAGIRNDVNKAQADLNTILQQEDVYRNGGLADGAKAAQLAAQETTTRAAIRDALEAQGQAAYDSLAALQKLHGDDVAAAQTTLAKATQAYNYAVQEYGRNSAEASSALAQVLQAKQQLTTTALAQTNSALDLDIANLSARGKAGDDVAAAQDSVKKARNAINSYLHAGGKSGTATYNQLAGQLATAQRTAFDTALQAQLDTLDFQQQTYQITSSQEVASLQQILKNKQLTLKEQRDITLKIKSLQQSIRDQLTQGGMNIPSNITLPTAYEVRRSLGSGFAGAGSTSSIVNNNQQVSVSIQNMVPTAQIAAQIANQVIGIINQQTGQQVRANSSTPRLVPTK